MEELKENKFLPNFVINLLMTLFFFGGAGYLFCFQIVEIADLYQNNPTTGVPVLINDLFSFHNFIMSNLMFVSLFGLFFSIIYSFLIAKIFLEREQKQIFVFFVGQGVLFSVILMLIIVLGVYYPLNMFKTFL